MAVVVVMRVRLVPMGVVMVMSMSMALGKIVRVFLMIVVAMRHGGPAKRGEML